MITTRAAIAAAVLSAASLATTTACGVSAEPDRALRELRDAGFDSAHHVEVESLENSAFAGKTYYSDVSHTGQVWLLRQRSATSKWIRYGILVRNRRVYFAVLDGHAMLTGAGCVQCHANGPRALRGDLRAGTEADRAALNAAIESIGPLEPYYPSADSRPEAAAHRLTTTPCANCHDGVHRAWLTQANPDAIAFQIASGFMPPDGTATAEQRKSVAAFLAGGENDAGAK